MGLDDKAGNTFEDAKGQAKEKFGEATGDEKLQAEGKGDQVSAALKDGAEKIKDAAKNIGDKFKN